MNSRRIAALFLSGMLVIHLVTWWQERHFIAQGYPDFTTFYAAGKIVSRGMGHLLYDEPTQWQTQREFAPGVSVRQASLPWVHAPYEALLFVPLSLLPYADAYFLWTLLNLGLLLAVPWLLRPHFSGLQKCPWAYWILGVVSFFPAFFTLFQGQDTILLLLLYALAFVALDRGADFSSGCWLGLGIFRAHLVAPMILILLLARKWRVFAGFGLMSVGLALLSAVTVGWSAMLHYPQYVWWFEQHTGKGILLPKDTPNLRGLLENALTGHVAFPVILAVVATVSVVVICLAVLAWHGVERRPPSRFHLAFAFSLVATSMLSFHTFAYDFSVLWIAVVIVLNHMLMARSTTPWQEASLLFPVVALFFTPLYFVIWFRWNHPNLMGLVVLLWAAGILSEIVRVARENKKQLPSPA